MCFLNKIQRAAIPFFASILFVSISQNLFYSSPTIIKHLIFGVHMTMQNKD